MGKKTNIKTTSVIAKGKMGYSVPGTIAPGMTKPSSKKMGEGAYAGRPPKALKVVGGPQTI